MKSLYLVLAAAALSFSCNDHTPPSNNEPSETTTSQCIIDGDTVRYDDIGSPLLRIESLGKACSSTQISDTWLITAHHCLTNEDAMTGGTQTKPNLFSVDILSAKNVATVDATYLHPTLDIGLIHLSAPLLGTDGEHHTNVLMPSNVASLAGQTVYQQGWGAGSVFVDDDAGNLGYSGIKVLRSAYYTMDAYATWGITVLPNACGQMSWNGDSGSALFGFVNGARYIIGITSSGCCATYVGWVHFVPSDTFADWATKIMGS